MRKSYLATCLASLLVLAACGGGDSSTSAPGNETGGGGGNGGGETTPTVAFELAYDSSDIEERSSFTVTASSSVEGVDYDWTYPANEAYSASIEGSTLTVTVGELVEDVAFDVTVEATAEGYEGASEDVSFNLIEVDRAKLPPELTVAEAVSSIEGVDANENGLRDDVELALYELYEDSYEYRTVAHAVAKTYQQQLLSPAIDDAAIEAAAKSGLLASYCLSEFIEDEKMRKRISLAAEHLVLDISSRRQAFQEFVNSRQKVVVNVSDVNIEGCTNLFQVEDSE